MTDDDPEFADLPPYAEGTPESRAALEARHAAMEPVIRPLFARPVTGDGVRGDVLATPAGLPPGVAPGDRVTAQRLGWDDGPEDDDRTGRPTTRWGTTRPTCPAS